MQKLIIAGELPDLNKIIDVSKKHWAKYYAFKKRFTGLVKLLAIRANLRPVERYPVALAIDWYCKDRRKDPDNIAHAKKYILDGLVEAGILQSDGFKCIMGFKDSFFIDKRNPRIEVKIKNFNNSRKPS